MRVILISADIFALRSNMNPALFLSPRLETIRTTTVYRHYYYCRPESLPITRRRRVPFAVADSEAVPRHVLHAPMFETYMSPKSL